MTMERLRLVLARTARRSRRLAAAASSRLLGPFERRSAHSWRADVLRRGVDITAEAVSDPRPLLVIAPHPDDETIGCGVLMARRHDAGRPVVVVVVSDGETSHRSAMLTPSQLGEVRRQESRSACGLLGVTDVRFLSFGEREIRQAGAQMEAALADIVLHLGPGQIAIPHRRDWHPEHVIVHDVAARALRNVGFTGAVREYPVWSWADGPAASRPMAMPWTRLAALVRWRQARASTPSAHLVSTDGYAARKRAAFALYRTQVTSYTGEDTWHPFPRGWIDTFVDGPEVYFPHQT